MSMSASTQIINDTSGILMFTTIGKVNDDATWAINPPVGTKLNNGESCTISMGNASFFPRGVGFAAEFVTAELETGGISLDDPAVGKHEFTTNGNFNFAISNPNGNSYVVKVTNK